MNIKKRNVSTQGALWTTSAVATMLYIFIGWIRLSFLTTAGTAFDIDSSGNLIPVLSTVGIPVILTKITTYLFPIVMLMPSIPVSFLVTEDNLVQNEVCGKRVAQFLAFIVPWFCAIPFLSGNGLFSFINWASLVFVSTANFIIPMVIYLRCLVFRRQYNLDRTTLTAKQRKLLKLIHSRSNTIKNFIDSSDAPLSQSNSLNEIQDSPQHLPTNEFSGVTEENLINRKSTVMSVFAPYFRSSDTFPDLQQATEEEIDQILTEDVPDPMTEDMEYFKQNSPTRASSVSGRDSSSEHLVPPIELNTLEIPSPAISGTERLGVVETSPTRLRSRSPVSFAVPPAPATIQRSPESRFNRKDTLPSHPQYIGRTFRSVPRWVGAYVSPRVIAIGCLAITVSITIVNIVLNIALPPP